MAADESDKETTGTPADELIPDPLPDTLVAPENTIYVIPDHPLFTNAMDHFSKPERDRDWFWPQYNYCLPLLFANQHGFIVRIPFGFVARWNGSPSKDGMRIHFLDPIPKPQFCEVSPNIGYGLLSLRIRCLIRTPPNVNLMVKEPPNYPIDGLSWMDAVVESDNLRREFNFNIQVTRVNQDIYVPKGSALGCFLPYPRYFLDNFELEELKDPEQLRLVRLAANYHALADRKKLRDTAKRSKPTLAYMEGRDAYGFLFKQHQKSLDNGEWWAKVLESQASSGCPMGRIGRKTAEFYKSALFDPTDTEFGALHTAQELHFQAYLLLEEEKYEEAESRMVRCVEVFRQYAPEEERFRLMEALQTLGFLHRMLGKTEAAVTTLEEALRIGEELKSRPEILVRAMTQLSFAYKDHHHNDAARSMLDRAKDLAAASGYPPLDLAQQVEYLAFFLRDIGELEQSAEAFTEVLRLQIESLGSDDELVKQTESNLAFVYRLAGKPEEAEKLEN